GTISPSMQSKLEPFLEELRRDKDLLVLPRILDEDRVQWYVLCGQSRLSRSTRDEIRAFIGATYSDYDTHPAQLNPADPVDAAVLQRYGQNAFKFDIPNRE